MTDRSSLTIASIVPADVPALAGFARGYLHQDMVEEHQTLVRAFDTFWADADAAERRGFLKNWEVFDRLAARASWTDVRAALERLGAVWTPGNRRSFRSLARAVGAKGAMP